MNKLEGGADLLREMPKNVPHICPRQLGSENGLFFGIWGV